MRHVDAVAMFDGTRFDKPAPSTWADLGCGDGTFTLALAERLAPGSTIHAVDRDARAVRSVPPAAGTVRIATYVSDFTRPWPFASVLDGILMANSLHFVASQRQFLHQCEASLAPSGRFLIVEYDTEIANPWVRIRSASPCCRDSRVMPGFAACRNLVRAARAISARRCTPRSASGDFAAAHSFVSARTAAS